MNSGLTAALVILFLVLAAVQVLIMFAMEKEAMIQKLDQDQAAIEQLVIAIVEIPHISFEIVRLWLEKNDYMLVPKKGDRNE